MRSKINKIKVLALDVDGVLTDGRIIYDSDGKEIKLFDVQDGFGLVLFRKLGFKTAIITARNSNVVRIRAKDLSITKTYLNAFPKMDYYERMLKHFGVGDEQVCYIGDDLPDYHVLKRAGFGVAVKNAVGPVRRIADYTTKREGGHGAVREVIELILKTQGRWKDVLSMV